MYPYNASSSILIHSYAFLDKGKAGPCSGRDACPASLVIRQMSTLCAS